jgi:hypothetical protein
MTKITAAILINEMMMKVVMPNEISFVRLSDPTGFGWRSGLPLRYTAHLRRGFSRCGYSF